MGLHAWYVQKQHYYQQFVSMGPIYTKKFLDDYGQSFWNRILLVMSPICREPEYAAAQQAMEGFQQSAPA